MLFNAEINIEHEYSYVKLQYDFILFSTLILNIPICKTKLLSISEKCSHKQV